MDTFRASQRKKGVFESGLRLLVQAEGGQSATGGDLQIEDPSGGVGLGVVWYGREQQQKQKQKQAETGQQRWW